MQFFKISALGQYWVAEDDGKVVASLADNL